MINKLKDQSKILTGRVKVPTGTTPAAFVSIVLTSQHPILKDLKILLTPGTILAKDVGIQVFTGGRIFIPAMGSSEDVTFTPGWAGLAPGLVYETGEINEQMPGAPFALELRFYNANAADAYIFIWARVAPKIELPVKQIEDDKLLKVESSDS